LLQCRRYPAFRYRARDVGMMRFDLGDWAASRSAPVRSDAADPMSARPRSRRPFMPRMPTDRRPHIDRSVHVARIAVWNFASATPYSPDAKHTRTELPASAGRLTVTQARSDRLHEFRRDDVPVDGFTIFRWPGRGAAARMCATSFSVCRTPLGAHACRSLGAQLRGIHIRPYPACSIRAGCVGQPQLATSSAFSSLLAVLGSSDIWKSIPSRMRRATFRRTLEVIAPTLHFKPHFSVE